jgi:transcriptional regulator with GAF, ATPase, and Fis domain
MPWATHRDGVLTVVNSVSVRVIAAANCDLVERMRAGRFQEDFYFRLAVFPIQSPPLRERLDSHNR